MDAKKVFAKVAIAVFFVASASSFLCSAAIPVEITERELNVTADEVLVELETADGRSYELHDFATLDSEDEIMNTAEDGIVFRPLFVHHQLKRKKFELIRKMRIKHRKKQAELEAIKNATRLGAAKEESRMDKSSRVKKIYLPEVVNDIEYSN